MSDDDKMIDDLQAAAEINKADEELAGLLLEASERIGELIDEVEEANEAAREAQAELDEMEATDYAKELFEAIVERRTDDAVEILEKTFNTKFISPVAYQRMFSERVKNG